MRTNENPLQSTYQQLLSINSDLTLLEALLENVNSMPDRARGELEHFVIRINERVQTVIEEVEPPIPEA